MTRSADPTPSRPAALTRHEGEILLDGASALLKGLLEAESPVALVAAPERGLFAAVIAASREESCAELLRGHDLAVDPVAGGIAAGGRAVVLAAREARAGRAAVALIDPSAMAPALSEMAAALERPFTGGGALVLVVGDDPRAAPGPGPRETLRRLDVPTLEPATLDETRDALDGALRLSRACGRPAAVVMHHTLLHGAETITARPNRVIESVDAMLARRQRRRRARLAESADVLRLVRRLEVNRSVGRPSPGERIGTGFITVGPASAALAHLVHVLRLVGRVPQLHLGAVHPIDDAVVGRMLERCERAVVLEPRPGEIEAVVTAIAEALRQQGGRPAAVYGQRLPPDASGAAGSLGPDEALHPSRLARRALHLLHAIRPSGRVASRLMPDPPPSAVEVPERGAAVGPAAAVRRLRRLAVDVDQWLRGQDLPEGMEPSALAIDGSVPHPAPPRVVLLEVLAAAEFRRDGAAVLRPAAWDTRPRILLLADVEHDEEQDLLRLARALVPASRADRTTVEGATFRDRAELAERVRVAAIADRMTILVVRDGPPPRFDPDAIERTRQATERLGFEPVLRVTRPADLACAIRPLSGDRAGEVRAAPDEPPLATTGRTDRLPRPGLGRLRFTLRPLQEQVEVKRTRPPLRGRHGASTGRLPQPEIVHRTAAQWRVHIAGPAGSRGGLAAAILGLAGRAMGYAVGLRHDPDPIGPGRSAWTQLLFTRPRAGDAPPPLTVRVPLGEADVILGVDAAETLRALTADPALCVASPSRTFAVVNSGVFPDAPEDDAADELRVQLRTTLRETARLDPLSGDFVAACRRWFHAGGIVDVAVLGAAFQRGLVPVTIDAIEAAVGEIEASGVARASDAFAWGRSLAVDPRPLGPAGAQPAAVEDEEDLDRTVRRMLHTIGRGRSRGVPRAAPFAQLLDESLGAMPGLGETDAGRRARLDFVIALDRCTMWGGLEYARRYGGLVTALYRADRGAAGRALTRSAILPLAEAMLIRDPVFVATMATSGEQRLLMRQRLNVKRSRGDEVTRRYLTRMQLVALGRRWRLDVRTSDWPARLLASLRGPLPQGWRGNGRQRDLKADVTSIVERATRGAADDYDRHQRILALLHQQAVEGRLRDMARSELAMLVGEEAGGGT